MRVLVFQALIFGLLILGSLADEQTTNQPELDVCSVDNGCPASAMSYATGSFTNEFLLSDAALQSANNLTLHLHLCCGYTMRGELLINLTMYKRFLVELLHVSPLSHLNVKEQLSIFPHNLLTLTKTGADGVASRYTPADFAGTTDPDQVPDGDIITLVVAPQGANFRLTEPSRRYSRKGMTRPTGVENFGIDFELSADHAHRLEGSGISPSDEILTEFQMFIPNFAIKCKCPHTLPVLPLLKYRRDTLPPLSLEGIGSKCITDYSRTTAVGPWSRLLYTVDRSGSRSARHQHQQQVSGTALRFSKDGDVAPPLPLTAEEISELMVDGSTVVANTFFDVSPAHLPPFTRLKFRLYEVSDALANELASASLNSNDAIASQFAGASQSAEAELYRADGLSTSQEAAPTRKISIQEQNMRLRFPQEHLYGLLAKAEGAALRKGETRRLKMVAESDMTTNVSHDFGRSDRFDIHPNRKYLITVDARRGEARQVLRGLFVLRMPAWMANPSQFLSLPTADVASSAKKSAKFATSVHNHMLFGRDLKLDFSKFALGGYLGDHYRRVWAPMEAISANQARAAVCLQKFKLLQGELEERKREAARQQQEVLLASSAAASGQAEGQHSDYFEIFASAEAKAKLLALRKGKLEAQLVKEAEHIHQKQMADAECRDVFAVYQEQLSRGQSLRFIGGSQTVDGSADRIPEQFRNLRDPNAAIFSYDIGATYNVEDHPLVLLDHLEDGSWHRFPMGVSSVGVWLVDEDSVCNATRVEVAKVHALYANIIRPANRTSTVCTTLALLEAEKVADVLASAKATFPALSGSADSSSAFDCKASWSCFDFPEKIVNQRGSEAAALAYVKENPDTFSLNVTNKEALKASVVLNPQTTSKCLWSLRAVNVPKLDSSSSGWLHIDAMRSVVERPPSYFTPTQDLLLEDNVTVQCRAFWLPLQLFVDVNTKDAEFTIFGLPPSGAWTTHNNAPIRFVRSSKAPSADSATFQLLDNDIFDVALDEASRNVANPSYNLQQNRTGGYAYVVLPQRSLLFTINYDESGTCPPGQVEVVVRLTQTPPAPVSPSVEEVFIEEPCVLLYRPRNPTSDEVVQWATTGPNAETKDLFADALTDRSGIDEECSHSIRISLHDSEELALSGEHGLASHNTARRAANGKAFARVCGIPEGNSCGIKWSATNAAGSVSKSTVIHRCRLPPTVNFYSKAPTLKSASSFSKQQIYEDAFKLPSSLTIAGNISLYTIAGNAVNWHYRLADRFAPSANDHTLTEAGRMRVYIEYDSATRFPYIYNVSQIHGVKPYIARSESTDQLALRASEKRRVNVGTQSFRNRISTDTESLFVNGVVELSFMPDVTHNDSPTVCTAKFSDLGNTTRQLFVATVEVDRTDRKVSDIAIAPQSTTQSIRVRDEFQKRKLCRTSHRPFAIYSLQPEVVLALHEHPSTSTDNNAARTGRDGSLPLIVRFCTSQYDFIVKREMFTTLGYDFSFECPSPGMKVVKLSETETSITPSVLGSSARCTFTVENHASNTIDSVEVELQSVVSSITKDDFTVYLFQDIRDDVMHLGVAGVTEKHPQNGTIPLQRSHSLEKPAYRSPLQPRKPSTKPRKVDPNSVGTLVAVGPSVDLLAYSSQVTPFSGTWRVYNILPLRQADEFADALNGHSQINPSKVSIRETSTNFACVDQCVAGALSGAPVSGFYTVGYDYPDTINPDVCPPRNSTRVVLIYLAQVITSEIVTCVPNVTVSAEPLPLAHRAEHYGKWSVITHHLSPTETSRFPEEMITFDNPHRHTTTIRGLHFGIWRLKWSIYRNGTADPLDSAVLTIKVLTDTLPQDRVVTFKDTAVVLTTSSSINWFATKPSVRLHFHKTTHFDPSVAGELRLSRLPLGVTRLRYDIVKSVRAAQFPALAHLTCPKAIKGSFFVERVAASMTAGTTMRVECHAYSGQGVITLRLATGGSDDIRLVQKEMLQGLIFNGTAILTSQRPYCRVPWWAREERARWLNLTYFDNGRAANITVRATEYLSQEEVETVPMFATAGQGCPESGGFLASSIIEGVAHEGTQSLYVPILDPVSASLHSNFRLKAIEGQRLLHSAGESQVSKGNASVDIALLRGASFGFRSNGSLLISCLRGEVPMSAFAKAWTVLPPTTHRGRQAWERYIDAAGNLHVRCEPLVFLPHSSTSQSMTISQLENQLQVIHQDTVQTLRNRDGIDVHGLSRSTQVALASRRVSSTQLAEILHRNRRMEAERLARATTHESDSERFDRVMALSASVFGDDAVVSAIRVTLPAYPPFFTTEDILLGVQVAKATVCSILKDDPEAPTNVSGHGQSAFGQLLVEDEPSEEEVMPNTFTQCQFESNAPAFQLHVRNGAFRPDASLETCRLELIDDGIFNGTVVSAASATAGSDIYGLPYGEGRHGPVSSFDSPLSSADSVGLHACFSSFLRDTLFQPDPLSQKKLALRLSSCPTLKMIDLEEYNSYEPAKRSAFLSRMTLPHHLRIVLHDCIVPDKHSKGASKSLWGLGSSSVYVDGTFKVVIQPTMAHLRVISASSTPADQQQLVDPKSSELDRLVLCESDVQSEGALLGIELSGDRWHPAVGEQPSRGGQGSRNVAMLNAFSVIEKEEYLTVESIYEHRQRIAKLVDSRFDTSDETFGKYGRSEYEDLAHASSGAQATPAIKVSKFMHYMYQQFWSEQNKQDGGTKMKPLVTRYNDTFVTVRIPNDANGKSRTASHTMQAYERQGYGSEAAAPALDAKAWGFGGIVEEVRIAIPGVTTTCNACLLTDVNFFFVGDFAGSLSRFSQRALSHRMMAERSQIEVPLRFAVAEFENDHPVTLYHQWMCPNTAAKRLQRLVDVAKSRKIGLGGGASGPVAELVLLISLGQDTPSMEELGLTDVVVDATPAASAAMRTTIIYRNASAYSSELEATIVIRSSQASVLPARILHELEISLQFSPESLGVAHRAIAAAMRFRKSRLGYGAAPEDLAFSGVLTMRTCVSGERGVASSDESLCTETASRSVVVGPWELEVAPVVTPSVGAQSDRSYVAEGQRRVNKVVHGVRSGFATFALLVIHHIITAYAVLRLRSEVGRPRGLGDESASHHLRGRSPDPTLGPLGYSNYRASSVSLSEAGGPAAGNTVIFLGAFVVAALLCQFTFLLWVTAWIGLWLAIIVSQRTKTSIVLATFLLHFMVFLAAVRQ